MHIHTSKSTHTHFHTQSPCTGCLMSLTHQCIQSSRYEHCCNVKTLSEAADGRNVCVCVCVCARMHMQVRVRCVWEKHTHPPSFSHTNRHRHFPVTESQWKGVSCLQTYCINTSKIDGQYKETLSQSHCDIAVRKTRSNIEIIASKLMNEYPTQKYLNPSQPNLLCLVQPDHPHTRASPRQTEGSVCLWLYKVGSSAFPLSTA